MPALLICIVIVVSDQLTKFWVQQSFQRYELREITSFFNLTYVRNPGAAWGMLGDQNTALTIISIVMLFLMVIFRRSFLTDTWSHRIALGLMTGGILGNVIDRVRDEYVTDFLDFHLGLHHWPSFNIADSAICVGVGIYIVSSFWITSHPLNETKPGRASKTESTEGAESDAEGQDESPVPKHAER